MTKNDVIKLALDAGGRMYASDEVEFFLPDLERFAALVAAAVLDEVADMVGSCDPRATPKGIAAAIRARGYT